MVANEGLEHYALRVTFNYVLLLLTVSISWKKKAIFLPICTAAILLFFPLLLRSVTEGGSMGSKSMKQIKET